MQLLLVGGLVEVEVARQNLIRAFAAQDLREYQCVLTPSTRLSDGVRVAPDAIDATRV